MHPSPTFVRKIPPLSGSRVCRMHFLVVCMCGMPVSSIVWLPPHASFPLPLLLLHSSLAFLSLRCLPFSPFFRLGFFFSPVIPGIVLVNVFILFYVKMVSKCVCTHAQHGLPHYGFSIYQWKHSNLNDQHTIDGYHRRGG